MKYQVLFHRGMFAIMLVVAFFTGALNAGRADMLERQSTTLMLNMSLEQLTNVNTGA